MSYHLSAYAVDLDQVRGAIGSQDVGLLAQLSDEFADKLRQIDDLLADAFDPDESEGQPLGARDVLSHLIRGEPDPNGDEVGFAYGYCLEILCRHFGEELNNSEWCSMRSSWFDTVQSALETAGVGEGTFSVSNLANRGAPVPIPEIDDFPGIGYLSRAEIGPACQALDAADLSRVEDPEAAASIQQVRDWFHHCVRSNRDLICFYA